MPKSILLISNPMPKQLRVLLGLASCVLMLETSIPLLVCLELASTSFVARARAFRCSRLGNRICTKSRECQQPVRRNAKELFSVVSQGLNTQSAPTPLPHDDAPPHRPKASAATPLLPLENTLQSPASSVAATAVLLPALDPQQATHDHTHQQLLPPTISPVVISSEQQLSGPVSSAQQPLPPYQPPSLPVSVANALNLHTPTSTAPAAVWRLWGPGNAAVRHLRGPGSAASCVSEGEQPTEDHPGFQGHISDVDFYQRPMSSKKNKRQPDGPLRVQLRTRKGSSSIHR
ncbi:uncharacterized protein A4U43_C10F15040 [Asparagus officinalis]|uniref:Uncharacterized protein n=1 Tax=Asparagus officinalis TaxID=4686 RepID=A0A5P1E4Q2_ASPOF|nr:uncharacterized protein A4U43_C10F15040 [Asparagus officinalis]